MRVSEKYASKYLRAEHLQGRAVRVQIARVEEDVEMGKEKELKDVVYFKGGWKPLVLNKTNAESLAQILGDNSDAWPGGDVILYPMETQTGPGVRIQEYRAEQDAGGKAIKATKAGSAFEEANPPPYTEEELDSIFHSELN